MPQYLSPGVYVEEKDPGPRPITGVSTSIAGALGVTLKGPTSGRPVLVTNFAEFTTTFGSYMAEPADPAIVNDWAGSAEEGGRWWQFAHAVQGFFVNGGQQLFVKRVFSSAAVASSGLLGGGLVSSLAADARAGDDTVTLEHLINLDDGGPNPGTSFRLVRGDTLAAFGPFTVRSYDPVRNRVAFDGGPLPEDLEAGRDFAEIHPRPAAPVTTGNETLLVEANALGAWGDDVSVRVLPMIGATLGILPDPGQGPAVFSRVVAPAATGATTVTVAEVPGQLDAATPTPFTARIGAQRVQVGAVAAGGAAGQVDLTVPALPADVRVGTTVQRLRTANLAAADTIYVANAGRLYRGAVVELDNGSQKETRWVTAVEGALVTLNQDLTLDYLEDDRVWVVEARVLVRYAPAGQDPVDEVFANLRLVRDGSPSSLVEHVNARSRYVDLTVGPNYEEFDLTAFPTAANGGWHALDGGDDALDQLTVDDFVGVDGGSGNRSGIESLVDEDDIAIVLVPGVWARTVQSALIAHCETLKDRFAVLDTQDGLSVQEVRDVRSLIDTRYAALYYPWLVVRDPLTDRNIPVAPSGHMAGIYARVDDERGVHKAPANEVIRSINRLDQDVTKREQDLLNPEGINALRFFPGRGNRVWGARVATSDTLWQYVNVRRLFIFIEESIDEGTQFVVFEPNDPELWARVILTISQFLTTQWRNGALVGLTADDAFFVRCGPETMTQDDIDQGRLICEIGIAPSKPAEFVIFRIQQQALALQTA
jgi:Bacteriophage tail sheath protein